MEEENDLFSLCIKDGTLKIGDSAKNRYVHNRTERFSFSGSYGTSSPSMPLVRQSRLGSRSSAYSAAISMGSHGTIPGYSFGQTAERIEPRQNFEEINCYLDSMDPRSELLFMRNSRSYHSMPKGQYLSINGVRNSAPCLLPDYIERYGNFGSEEPYGQSRDRMDRLRSYNDMNLYWPEDESQMNRQCHRMSLDLSPALDKNLIAHDEYDIQSDLQQNHQHTLDYEGSFQQPYVERRSSVNSLQDTTEYGSEDNLIMEVKVHHPAERKNSEVEMLSQDYLHGKI